MNILYITDSDPRETGYGAAQRTYWLWLALKRIGTVYTVSNVGHEIALSKDEKERIASWRLASSFRPFRTAQAFFANVASPMVWPFKFSRSIYAKLPWRDVKFDAVVVRYLHWAETSRAWQFGQLYVDIDDLPTEAYEKIFRKNHRGFTGWLWGKFVPLWQARLLRKCHGAWVSNPMQVECVQKFTSCLSLPNLPMPPKASYVMNGRQKRQLMTVGLMGYQPNYEGVDWFVDNVWPEVRRRYPDLTYAVVGGGVPKQLAKKWKTIAGVEVRGFVEDLDALYEQSLAVVAPIFLGAGTCIKVAEAVIRGRKLFATKVALRGYEASWILDSKISEFKDADDFVRELTAFIALKDDGRDALQMQIFEASQNGCAFESFANQVQKLIATADLAVKEER